MKKFLKPFSILLSFMFVILTLARPVQAASGARYELPFEVNAQSYLLVSLDTGEVIFEKNSRERYIPASLTKLLTAYTVYQYVEDLDGTMISAPRYVYDELYGLNGSTADIRQGETLSARQLLYALLLPSSNEAANILADYVGNGSIPNFCMMMNNEARKLGCANTNFTNAHGLFTDNHYTCAWDMYLIAKACYETPGFMDIVTTTTYQLPANSQHASPYYIQSTISMQNRSSSYYRSYVKGMKTGSLDEIGHNFVTVCQQDGQSYILVVIGAAKSESDSKPAFTSAARIMDYFFENYSLRSANRLEYPITEIELKYSSDADRLLLYPDTQVMAVLPNDVDESSFQKVYNLPESVGAPIKSGDVIGTVDYYLAGQKVGTSQLVSHDDMDRNIVLFLVGKFQEAYQSLYFRVVLCVSGLMAAGYVTYVYVQRKKHDKMRKVHRGRR